MVMSCAEIAGMLTAPGQFFEIETVPVDGHAVRAWKNAPSTIPQIVARSRDHGGKEFIVCGERRLRFDSHYAQVAALAHWLVDGMGLQPGDRVAIAMRNRPEWSVAFWAASTAGAVVVPLNGWWSGEELAWALADSGSVVLFADRERLDRVLPLGQRLGALRTVVDVDDDGRTGTLAFSPLLRAADPDAELPAVTLQPDDPATLFYTSGSTGKPKGALGTHRNVCNVTMNLAYNGVQTALRAGLGLQDLASLQQVPVTALLSVPLFHVTGCHGLLLGMLHAGGTLVMMRKWDPREAVALIARERVTMLATVPTMAWQLLEAAADTGADLSSLRTLGYGGAPAAPELRRRVSESLPGTGVSNGWGITETASAITVNAGPDYAERPQSVGRPFPVFEVQAIDVDGTVLPPDGVGELRVRGAGVARGYWNAPEATAQAFREGWFHTGDVGRVDADGFVYILDRLKDMIIRGGENVYCAEVEAALLTHPAVAAACVFGVPHAVLGEEVGGVVQTAPGQAIDADGLRAHLAARLARYKIPAHLWLQADPLPLGATGKIQKKELRATYAAKAGAPAPTA